MHWPHWLLFIPLPLLPTASAAAPHMPRLLFHASYDTGVDADSAGGKREARPVPAKDGVREPSHVPGVFGRALEVERGGLRYGAAGNLNHASGSIEFWFKPLDWDGADSAMHHLFGTENKPRCHMLIYRYMRTTKKIAGIFGKFAFYLKGGAVEDPKHELVIPSSRVSDDWVPGQWHHVVGTWGKRSARLYVDGALVGEAHGKLPGQPPASFTVSANSSDKGGVGNVVDDLRIYASPLRPNQVTESYLRGRRALAALRAGESEDMAADPDAMGKQLRVGALFQDGLSTLLVRIDASGLPLRELSGLRGDVEVLASDGVVVTQTRGVPLSELGVAQARVPTAALAPGAYRLRVNVRPVAKAPKPVAVWTERIERPDARWLGNSIGISDRPVPPFEPVTVEGSTVRVWGKRYSLDNAFILAQATVSPDPNAALHRAVRGFWRDASLLAGPIRLTGGFDAEEVSFATAAGSWQGAAATHAVLETRTQHGAVEARSTVRIDDDSIITADLSLTFGRATHVRDLKIEIPLRSEYCRWMNWTSLDGHRDASGAAPIPEGQGVVWRGVFHPLLWLGDDYRGFGCFFDTSLGWAHELTDPDRVLVRRTGEVTTVVLRLVPDEPARAEPWRTRVSFLATPARPLPRQWRGTVLGGNFSIRHVPYAEGSPRHVVYWWTNAFFEDKQSHFSSPRTDTIRLDAIRDAIAQNGDEPISHVFYTYPNSYDHPVVPAFYSDWCTKSSDDLVSGLSSGEPPQATRVDWNSSVKDWWLTQMSGLADLGVDGIYCDDPYTHPSFNERTGTAFAGPAGAVRPNYGLYGLREYFRRLRQLLHEKANHPHMLLHMSNQLTLPFQIYFDSFANGEHLNRRLKQHYIGKLTPAEIRAQYLGYQWGNIPFILPELGGEFRKSIEATEEMLALILPHDVLVWNAWCHPATTKAYNDFLKKEFRTWEEDCSFLPYWEATDAIAGQDDTLVASAYVRDASTLLLVANWGDAERSAELTLDWRVLTGGRAMASSRVALGKGASELTGKRLSVPVPAKNLRLVVLGP